MALRVASLGGRCSSRMMRSTDSMTTMALVHDGYRCQGHPEQAQGIDGKTDGINADECAQERHRMTSVGIRVARMFCRNTSHHQKYQHDRNRASVVHDLADGYRDELGASKGVIQVTTRREAALPAHSCDREWPAPLSAHRRPAARQCRSRRWVCHPPCRPGRRRTVRAPGRATSFETHRRARLDPCAG